MSKLKKQTPHTGTKNVAIIALAKRNLRLVFWESVITASVMCVPIMSPFMLSIGLSLGEIALTQTIFTITMILLDLPTAWLADKLSRKWANVIGDIITAIVYLAYACANSFIGVATCEILIGLGMSLSHGVDVSLMRHFVKQGYPDQAEEKFRYYSARRSAWRAIIDLVLMLLGGPIGAISFRLCIALSGLNHAVGAIIGIFIQDDSEKMEGSAKHPLRDMDRIIKQSFTNAKLRSLIFANGIAREVTHGIIWCFSPMMIILGVPVELVSIGWALSALASVLGADLATKYSTKLSDANCFAFSMLVASITCAILSLQLNLFTIWFYLLLGVVQGWTGATLMARVQRYVKAGEQTSVVSLTSIVSRLIYSVTGLAIGHAADINLRFAALATLLIFAPLSLLTYRSIKRSES